MKVAITGGIAEGKSTVLAAVEAAGYPVVDVDSLARELFSTKPIQDGLARILGVDVPVTPAQVRALVASDPSARRRINRLMHPPLLAKVEAVREGFFEVPLLIEACMQGDFDRVWVVTCGPEEQWHRLLKRYGDPELCRSLLATQLPDRAKIAFADVVVRTNAPPETVREFVSRCLRRH